MSDNSEITSSDERKKRGIQEEEKESKDGLDLEAGLKEKEKEEKKDTSW